MEKHLESMIDISTATWFLMLALVGGFTAVDIGEAIGSPLMAVSGWLLLLVELLVLRRSQVVLNYLVLDGHLLRVRCGSTAWRLTDWPL